MFRNSFEGVSVASSFWMKEVTVPRVPSLAFNFDHIKEFSIYGSRFDRVSMWGFKLARNVIIQLSFCPLVNNTTSLSSYFQCLKCKNIEPHTEIEMQKLDVIRPPFPWQLRRVQCARHDALLQHGVAVI